jgi:hypothetical protein
VSRCHLQGGPCAPLTSFVSNVRGQSVVSGVTAMSTSDHQLIRRHSNFVCNDNFRYLKQAWQGRVVRGLVGAGFGGAGRSCNESTATAFSRFPCPHVWRAKLLQGNRLCSIWLTIDSILTSASWKAKPLIPSTYHWPPVAHCTPANQVLLQA